MNLRKHLVIFCLAVFVPLVAGCSAQSASSAGGRTSVKTKFRPTQLPVRFLPYNHLQPTRLFLQLLEVYSQPHPGTTSSRKLPLHRLSRRCLMDRILPTSPMVRYWAQVFQKRHQALPAHRRLLYKLSLHRTPMTLSMQTTFRCTTVLHRIPGKPCRQKTAKSKYRKRTAAIPLPHQFLTAKRANRNRLL